jgi:hypothetical protein
MESSMWQKIGYLFLPEESSWREPQPPVLLIPARKDASRVSFKALFWAGLSIAFGLVLAKVF